MHFIHLPGFRPYQALRPFDATKYPKVTYKNKSTFYHEFVFHDKVVVSLIRKWEFYSFTYKERQIWLSEKNIYTFFSNPELFVIEEEYRIKKKNYDGLLENFINGYYDGWENFENELGPTYKYLSIDQKIKVLIEFIEEASFYLHFKGYLVPSYLYSLGYIQANFILACKEYNNYGHFNNAGSEMILSQWRSKHAKAVSTLQKVFDSGKTTPIVTEEPIYRIPLYHSLSDIVTLWKALIDFYECEYFSTSAHFYTEEQILSLMGMMFHYTIPDSSDSINLTQTSHSFHQVPPGNYKSMLNLLMHATYKLNQASGYEKVKLSKYAEVLKRTFSCYSGIAEDNMVKDFTRYIQDTCSVLKKMPQETYAYRALSVLKKIKEYNI